MKDLLQQFLQELQRSGMRKNSIEAYGRDIRLMGEWLETRGLKSWRTVTDAGMLSYRQELLASGKASATIARQLASQRRFIKFLSLQGVPLALPGTEGAVVKSERKPLLILTKAQVQALIAAPDLETTMGLRDHLMLKMLYETGIRVSEIIDLTLGDVDFKRKRILCSTPYESRMVYLNQELTKRLRRYLNQRGVDFDQTELALFANCYGQNISRQGLWKIVKSHAETAGLDKGVTPHTLRHSLAVHLLQEGGSLKHLQVIMGHQDVTSTQFYETYLDVDSMEQVLSDAII